MNRLFISIILLASTCFAFSQNLKVLDLSNGGCQIDSIRVEKIGNDFIIIPEVDSIAISQIVINVGEKHPLIVKRRDITVFEEETTNKTDIKKSSKNNEEIILPIFYFQVGNDYVVDHNGKQWVIKARKDGSLDALAKVPNGRAIFFNVQNKLCIGDSIVSKTGSDTLHYVLTDSLVVSGIDRLLSLKCGGKDIDVKLITDTDDNFYYSTKSIASADSIFHAGDTLTVEKSGKVVGVIIFEAKDKSPFHVWLLIVIVFVVVSVVTFVCLRFIRKRKKHGDNDDEKADKDDNKGEGGKMDDITPSHQMTACECWGQLNGMIEDLLRIMPKKVNGISKNKFFSKRDDLNDIRSNITLVNASNRKTLVEKCSVMLAFIDENMSVLTSNLHQTISATNATFTPEKGKDTSEQNIGLLDDATFTNGISTGETLAEHTAESQEETSPEDSPVGSEVQMYKEVSNPLQAEYDALKKDNEILQFEFTQLKDSYNELKGAYNKDINEAKSEARRQAEDDMQSKVVAAQRQADEAEMKRKEAEDSKKEAIEAAVKKEKDAQENEIKRLKEEKRKADDRAETAEKSKKKAVEDAVKKEKENYEKEERRLKDVVEKQKSVLTRTENLLKSSQNELKETKEDRDKKKHKIEQLEKAQEEFTCSLTSVPFATAYSKQVYDLLELGRQIQTSAYAVLDMDVDDPYFIMKALSRYGKMMVGIDMGKFQTDVNMVAKAKFVFKDSLLATFKGENKDIDNIVRSYFFNQYLEKYVNALMVLNESMAGLKLLLPEVKPQVDKFESFRTELLVLAKRLNIKVLYVKVGDMAGENVDLKAKPVDVEIGTPGQILEVENCIVYLTDSRKPQTKIKVTIKK